MNYTPYVGDDSFLAARGRRPTADDGEPARMATHLAHVRAWLAARPPTRPELAGRRAELLGYLDDYRARGVIPRNAHLPWRTPVFIDDDGAICAVGYLIERASGRALAEQIAAAHRYDLLEDIAAAMPEVAAWIDGSGFTLEELASIQPAYITANADGWKVWDLAAHPPADGAFTYERVAGAFARGAMTGPWTVKNAHDQVVGTGELARGAGTWHSFYADGTTRLADGPFVGNVAHGAWTFYHRNGTVAAEGRFTRGVRTGAWAFYDDAPDHHRIATGAFGPDGRVVGAWSHYDADGTLLARSRHDGARERIDVVPDRDGISRQLYQRADGNPVEWYIHGLERVARGADQLYLETTSASRAQIGFGVAPEPTDPPRVVIYDADGHRLARGPDGWTAADCHWPRKRIALARAGDGAWLDELLLTEARTRTSRRGQHDIGVDLEPDCAAPRPVDAARAAVLDRLTAAHDALRAAPPTFVRDLVLGHDPDAEFPSRLAASAGDDADLVRTLAAFTLQYVEWPHIDGQFERVFATMPGRWRWDWAGGNFSHVPSHDPADR